MTFEPGARANGLVQEPVGWPFLSVADLRKRLQKTLSGRPLVVDARAERQYGRGRLPGAINLPARELNPVEDGVRKLVDPGELRRRLSNWGGREIVVYGGRGGADAAHLWWTLRAVGFGRVLLLDGGIEAWLGEGEELETEAAAGAVSLDEVVPMPTPEGPGTERTEATDQAAGKADVQGIDGAGPEAAGAEPHGPIGREELLRLLGNPEVALVDTREPEEYRGEIQAAKRAGHLPGATLFPWTSALTDELRLRPQSQLRDLLAPVLEKREVVVYCQSGVRAAHTLAVLESLGHQRTRLYLGSWGEWGNREDVPVEVDSTDSGTPEPGAPEEEARS